MNQKELQLQMIILYTRNLNVGIPLFFKCQK